MRYIILSIAVMLGLSMSAQVQYGQAGDPMTGVIPSLTTGTDLNFAQYPGDDAGEISLLVLSYMCSDYVISLRILIQDENEATIYDETTLLTVSSSSQAAFTEVPMDGALINACREGSKLYFRYTDDHCGVESGNFSLIGFTKGISNSTFRN